MNFEVKDTFILDGKPFQIVSGAIHYFRVVPEYWQDRLEKLKALGCNTVETYIPWNFHEPRKGEFHFEGRADVARFVRLAQEVGLFVILRPSPYICAEWEWGGMPAWLLAEDGMHVRTCDSRWMAHVADYYRALLPRLAPLQIHRGGPVILMQLENEYGSYGNDKEYLRQLRDLLRNGGIKVPLITSDGPTYDMLHGGTVEGVWPTCNFGSRTEQQFRVLRDFAGEGPLMCTEFWCGWFDHWGNGGHSTGNLEESAKDLDKLLELGNVNLYMFHGGTSFGFLNGSNYYDKLTPDVTSYDYDAVLTEDGWITEKYRRYQEIIRKYREIPEVRLTTDIRRRDYGTLTVQGKVGLFAALDMLSTPVEGVRPQSMERLGQDYGYILYRTHLRTEERIERLRLLKANDRAQVFVDGKPVVTLYDQELENETALDVSFGMGAQMDILVENMGRVNYGWKLEDQRKGIDQGVVINGHMHDGWVQYPLPLDDLSRLDFSGEWQEGLPGFYRFTLEVDEAADTFLDFQGWGKGCVFVNGFNLGRFWEVGPQKRLYLPAPLLKAGKNEIILFETEGKFAETIALRSEPELG